MQKVTQRKRIVDYLKNYEYYPCIKEADEDDEPLHYRKYVFMTTVAMPAFEQDKFSVLIV